MHYSNKGKESKQTPHITVSSSPSETQATSRQKPFSRKPAYAVGSIGTEKKKKIFEESFEVMSLIKLSSDASKSFIKVAEPQWIKQKQKSFYTFSKQPQNKKQEESRKFRDSFYSPKSENANLLKGGNFFQRKPSKNITQFTLNQESSGMISRSFINSPFMQKNSRNDASFDARQFKKKWSYKALAAFSPSDSQKQKEQKKPNTKTQEKSSFDKSSFHECVYCSNNKKKAVILQEKYAKLQDQYDQRLQTIKQLTQRCNNLTKEKVEQTQKFQTEIQKYQHKQEQLLKLKEQIIMRADYLKKDVARLNEAVKYKQMEKSMLLRYKDQYELITKECDRLRYQNEMFKKQLIAINTRESKIGYAKNTSGSNTPTKVQNANFSKKPQNNADSNIYYDCQDDTISLVSLNLSEQSLDYV